MVGAMTAKGLNVSTVRPRTPNKGLSPMTKRQSFFGGACSAGPFGGNKRKLSIREEATVREVFELFDEDGLGYISRDEVAIVIQSILGKKRSCGAVHQ